MSAVVSIVMLILMPILSSSFAEAGPSSAQHPQGALWNLLETGRAQEAGALEKQLGETLLYAPIQKFSVLGGGDSKSWLAYFENNVVAVLKAEDSGVKDGGLREVAAYIFDRALGLNMVPLTIVRDIDGQRFTLQLYYSPQTEKKNNKKKRYTEFNSARLADMALFDYIMYNIDRDITAGRNFFVGDDGRLVAIDHSRAFYRSHEYELLLDDEYLRGASKDFKQKLNRLDLTRLSKELESYGQPVEVIREVIDRIHLIRQRLADLPGADLNTKVPSRKIPKVFTLSPSLERNVVYSLRDFPHILDGAKNPLALFARLGSDQFQAENPEFQRLLRDWSQYPTQEKVLFLRLILQMDEKMNKQKYVPVVIQRLLNAHIQDLPLVEKALSSKTMEDGYTKYLDYVMQSRFLEQDTVEHIHRFLNRAKRCDAVFQF